MHCTAVSHRDTNNPLRSQQGLGSAIGVEYAAQAMALHAAVSARVPVASSDLKAGPQTASGQGARHGVLASVRALRLHVARLDTFDTDLTIEVRLLSGDPRTALYEFELHANGGALVTGRASVLFQASGRA